MNDLDILSIESIVEVQPMTLPTTNVFYVQLNHNEEEYLMDKMKFSITTIVEALERNREEHIQVVKEAEEGYRKKAIKVVEDILAQLKAGKAINTNTNLHRPESHVDDFDRAIRMLRLSTQSEIELDERQFDAYVRNQWNWGRQFLQANASYSERAMRLMDT